MPRPKVEKHKTAEIILHSAQKHFLQKGFEGASIQDIAAEAKINKSLIYHHFGNKEKLWKAVKDKIIERAIGENLEQLDFKKPTLKGFLEAFITFRFRLYAHHPELSRLMAWQRLEAKSQLLTGVSSQELTNLESHITFLQESGQLRSDIKPDVANYLIMSMASNVFIDKVSFLNTATSQDQYLSLVIESLYTILKCRSDS